MLTESWEGDLPWFQEAAMNRKERSESRWVNSSLPTVEIIIPTLADRSRADGLARAIESVRNQAGAEVSVSIIVNGKSYVPEVLSRVKVYPEVSVRRLETANLPNALEYGRRQVDAAFFGFLDDDDVYLEDALATRLEPLLKNRKYDAAVGNGYVMEREASAPREVLNDVSAIEHDPFDALFRKNWLVSCGGLYRTERVGEEIFEDLPQYYEWTYVAYLLAKSYKIAFVEQPTFKVHDTVGSLSETEAYRKAEIEFIRRLVEEGVPPWIEKSLKERRTRALHNLSWHELREGRYRRAWHYHLRSLKAGGAFEYMAYTRKLLFPWFY